MNDHPVNWLRNPGVSRIRIRTAIAAAVALVLAGCMGGHDHRPIVRGPIDPGQAPLVGAEPVSGGIYISLGTVRPLSGTALSRGRASIDTIRESVASAAPAPPTTTQPATTEPHEAPPAAVKLYLEGRAKFLEESNTEAVTLLEKALAIDPNAFTVLRLMGRVCFASSQLARGALYLERAHAAEPGDVEVNYLLGRYWMERNDATRAIYYLLQAEESPERSETTVQSPLVSFHLARALQGAGYHIAAAREYERFLATVALPVPGFRYDRELNYLIDEAWATHLSAAENLTLCSDYRAALPHYLEAHAQRPLDAFITSRLVNAYAHTGRAAAAERTAMDLVAATRGSDSSLKLAAWAYTISSDDEKLITDLQAAMVRAGGDEAATATTLSAVLGYQGRRNESFAVLAAYEQEHPTDLTVLHHMANATDSEPRLELTLSAAARAINESSTTHTQVFQYLNASPTLSPMAAKAPVPLSRDLVEKDLPDRTRGTALYLVASLMENSNQPPDHIGDTYREAMRLSPDVFPVREAYVKWLLSQEQFEQASTLIQQAIDDKNTANDENAWALLVASEQSRQRYGHAMQVANEAVAKFPQSAALLAARGRIYVAREQFSEAETEFRSALEKSPKNEDLYKELLTTLLNANRAISADAAADSPNGMGQNTVGGVVARMVSELPGSRFAQVMLATISARNGQVAEGLAILQRLAGEAPDDPDVLAPLAQLKEVQGNADEATDMLKASLARKAQDRVAATLVEIYEDRGQNAEAVNFSTQLVKDHPLDPRLVMVQAAALVGSQRNADAIRVMKEGLTRNPRSQPLAVMLAQSQVDQKDFDGAVETMKALIAASGESADRLYLLTHFYAAAGDEGAEQKTLQEVLRRMPDHTGANNDLAYLWADGGKNLKDAEGMVKKALENEPNNSAFLDSLGWVYYKQGRFTEAAETLQKSIEQPGGMEAEVVQHLGDALYREGKKVEAMDRWSMAAAMLNGAGTQLTTGETRVKNYVDGVLAATRGGKEPTVTPTGQKG